MKKITRFIAQKVIKDSHDINNRDVRYQYGMLEGWVSIIGNTLLFILKIIIGVKIKSASLITDAVHTLADSLSSAVVIFGFKMAKKPSDKEHPFGHGRMESVAALIISVLLFVAGFEFLEFSIHRILKPSVSNVSPIIILIIFGTIIIKELMARFAYELGDMVHSKALKADALHHRSDVFATFLVVVALIAPQFGYQNVDGIMGVFVSFVIFYSAFMIAKEAITPLLGEAPPETLLTEIEKIASDKKDVMGVHDIICHEYGRVRIISLHIEVSDQDSVAKLHRISEEIEMEIGKKTDGMVVVHIDPINKNHPQYDEVLSVVTDIVADNIHVQSFHELRIIGGYTKRSRVVFDVVLVDEADEKENEQIVASIKERFIEQFPEMKVVIKIDPKYSYNF